MNPNLETASAEVNQPLRDTVQSVGQRIPPLWSLRNFVAVNPFLGLRDRHFLDAARLMQRVAHGDILMPAAYYQEQIATGRIQERDFGAALRLAPQTLPAAWAQAIDFREFNDWQRALARPPADPTAARVLTFADFLDARNGSGWGALVVEEISKWCSAYFDQGQSSWRMPWRHLNLFAAWKAAAQLDANPELLGLQDFRRMVAELPADHWEVIDGAIDKLAVPERLLPDFLHRQFLSLPGWSSYVQYVVRGKVGNDQGDDSLAQLLAIRLVYDLALRRQLGSHIHTHAEWESHLADLARAEAAIPPDLLARSIAQQALECGYQRELMAQLKGKSDQAKFATPKSLQAIFCIDVRSEGFRRALEAQSEEIETIGFAGFFGMAIEYLKFGQASGGAHCPVLLSPKYKVREALRPAVAGDEGRWLRRISFWRAVSDAWNSFKTSAISCFSFVETAGLWFGVKLVKDSLALAAPESAFMAGGKASRFGPRIEREDCCASEHGHNSATGIALPDQISLAASALKNMGLTANFASVVLICGHGSTTANNPYGSALDCGACGGHAGDANARVAAAILNQPAVRDALRQQGIEIPADTWFVAGLHNTTTDEIRCYEGDDLTAPQRAELAKIKAWLAAAARQARQARAASLGLNDVPPAQLAEQVFQRSRDWSQVRPEWGLAGNAAFVAAPRERTKGLNLGGRVFLHNYDARLDADHAVAELILLAPMVVASWINLQYYGSTVNNRLFGSGNKVLHNLVGTFGVWQGNGGDLQAGLPLQSLHDGTQWVHEPLRLSVFIQADPTVLRDLLARHQDVRELVANGWVNLFAMDASGQRFWRYCGDSFREEISPAGNPAEPGQADISIRLNPG